MTIQIQTVQHGYKIDTLVMVSRLFSLLKFHLELVIPSWCPIFSHVEYTRCVNNVLVSECFIWCNQTRTQCTRSPRLPLYIVLFLIRVFFLIPISTDVLCDDFRVLLLLVSLFCSCSLSDVKPTDGLCDDTVLYPFWFLFLVHDFCLMSKQSTYYVMTLN